MNKHSYMEITANYQGMLAYLPTSFFSDMIGQEIKPVFSSVTCVSHVRLHISLVILAIKKSHLNAEEINCINLSSLSSGALFYRMSSATCVALTISFLKQNLNL